MTGGVANASLPKTLAVGNWLIRFQIIALHLANSFGYPACAQAKVSGSGGAPTPDELVSIPGAYLRQPPQYLWPRCLWRICSVWFPGPAIASFVGWNFKWYILKVAIQAPPSPAPHQPRARHIGSNAKSKSLSYLGYWYPKGLTNTTFFFRLKTFPVTYIVFLNLTFYFFGTTTCMGCTPCKENIVSMRTFCIIIINCRYDSKLNYSTTCNKILLFITRE